MTGGLSAPAPTPASDSLVEAKRLVLMGRMTADVGHELNNLFGKIIGLAEMALDQVADRPDACAELETLISVTEQGARVIGRLDACSGWSIAEPRRFDPAALVGTAVAAAEARRPGLHHLGDRPAAPCWVVADDALVRIALDAVLDNASQWGAERIEVSCRIVEGGSAAEIMVRDDGAGMSSEVLARAFEPFFTTRPPGEGAGEAMGLGLALAKSAMAACAGRIEAGPADGGGVTVGIYLPLSPEAPAGQSI